MKRQMNLAILSSFIVGVVGYFFLSLLQAAVLSGVFFFGISLFFSSHYKGEEVDFISEDILPD